MTPEPTKDLSHPAAQELLHTAPLVRLAYTGPDDLPRVIPIGFHWDGRKIVVCTATNAPKVRALSKRADVALTIDTGDTPVTAKALLVRGVATIDIVDGVPGEYIAAATKSLNADDLREFERNVRSVYKQMARISITPSWARFYDFGAGRVPDFLTRLP
jgi:Pyridoxamine 5'-phosphate oxidase